MFTEYSLWLLLPIVIISIGVAYFVYFFKQSNKVTFALKQKYLLFSLRLLGIFLILLLLISPVKKIKNRTIEKPTVVILQDNSASISATKFGTNYKTSYTKKLDRLCSTLSKKYNIVRLIMGSKTVQLKDDLTYQKILKFNDFTTDISQSMDFVAEEFSTENLSAIILATDGITTQGNNFLNYDDKISCPIYTVAMGDTTIRKDISITDIQYNKITFVDTDYPIEITIKADKAIREHSSVFMTKEGKTTPIQSFVIDNDSYSITTKLKSISKKAGIEKISFYVSQINGEDNITNNKKDIFIEVLDTKKKVLILANYPHPDISAIKMALNNNQNYTVDVSIFDNNTKNPSNYDLVILHSLPHNSASYNIIKNLQDKGTSLMFVVGQGTNISLFNALNTGISLQALSDNTNNSLSSYNTSFSLFGITEDVTDILKDLPPLVSLTAKYSVAPNIQTLLFQKIGYITTNYPLIAYNNENISKKAFILGENIWRWRLHNYLINKSFNQIDEIISKTTQLVCNKSDKNRFRIEHKDVYQQSENIIFKAQLYNESFEMINTPEITLHIRDKETDNKYTFGKNNNSYYLNLGIMSQGEYSFTATTKYNNKEYKQNGKFVISSNNLELNDLVAKHSDLYTLSTKTNAKMVYPNKIFDLKNLIEQNDNIKPIIHINQENKRFISLWWYWVLIIFIWGSEWFLRKYWWRI